MERKRVKHLVVDSGAFIKNSPVHEYAENIYTVEGAVKEIKDKATRQRLQVLPYKLIVKEPTPEDYKYVLNFSKKTGDFSNLSVVDLQIIALTYQLEREYVGIEHLNKEPSCKVTSNPANIDTTLSGFYYPNKEKVNSEISDEEENISKERTETVIQIESLNEEETFELASTNIVSDDEYESASDGENNEKIQNRYNQNECYQNQENQNKDYQDQEYQNEDFQYEEHKIVDCDPDSDSWITPSNIAEVHEKMGSLKIKQAFSVVACVTTDFSVQNVLLQIGLDVVSVDGMLIKKAKVFILRCYGCYRTTNDNTKKFCPNCGNKTLKRVAVTVNDDGTKSIHINFNKPINIRGKRFSLPAPKGGKHAKNPIVCEDQPIPQQRMSKAYLRKTNIFQEDYETEWSPFSLNDIYSRSAHLGINIRQKQFDKKNPNQTSKRTGNKKRK